MSYIAGIDVDTNAIHCVYVDENDAVPPEYVCWKLWGHDAWERVRSVRGAMRQNNFWTDCMAIGLENPAGRAGTGLYAVMRTTGAVLACLPTEVLVQPWRPGEWRKAVGLKGNATKDEVRLFAEITCATGEMDEQPQDACDAYAIALATRSALRVGATDTGQTAA